MRGRAEGDPPNRLYLFLRDEYPVLTLVRGVAENYTLTPPETPWSWRRMLNGMTDQTLDRILGSGIIGFSCQPIPDSEDGKRLRAAEKPGSDTVIPDGAEMPLWDFVACRQDVTRVRFHPNHTNGKLSFRLQPSRHRPSPC